MNLSSKISRSAPSKNERRDDRDPYVCAKATAQLLTTGQLYRRGRIKASDMFSTDEAARLAGTSRATINAWINDGRCVGVSNLRGGFKLPRWQFEPAIWMLLQSLSRSLATTDGWQLLSFLESPSMALNGTTPRAALEQGVPVDRILALASAEAH